MTKNWADFAEDDDGDLEQHVELPERTETIDEKGHKIATFYERKEDGTIMRVKQMLKVIELRQKTPIRSLERRKIWKAFGNAAEGHKKEDKITYLSAEEIFMLTPKQDEEDDNKSDFADGILKQVQSAAFRSRQNLMTPQMSMPALGGASAKSSGSGPKYTPPVPQGHVPGSSSIPMRGPDDQPPALRVSNIPLEAQQQDIEDLFKKFGRVLRVYVPDPPRGYAFVTFTSIQEGKRAKEALNGFGYAHLILKVEWARPSTNRPQNSMKHASGYGKGLPQDKEAS